MRRRWPCPQGGFQATKQTGHDRSVEWLGHEPTTNICLTESSYMLRISRRIYRNLLIQMHFCKFCLFDGHLMGGCALPPVPASCNSPAGGCAGGSGEWRKNDDRRLGEAGTQGEAGRESPDKSPVVERGLGRAGGVRVFHGVRAPVAALFENPRDGATAEQFLERFCGVESVLEHDLGTSRNMLSDAACALGRAGRDEPATAAG